MVLPRVELGMSASAGATAVAAVATLVTVVKSQICKARRWNIKALADRKDRENCIERPG